jgi:release factor glutamine methyltransferase
MTIREILNLAQNRLKTKSTSPHLDAEVLLSHVLDKSKEYILLNPEKELSVKAEKQFKILLSRRAAGWPVPYLTNHREFFGLDFYVDKNVLIPRPETEELVDLVLQQIKGSPLKILDVGTGSGCIIISLAKNKPQNKYFASDISEHALKVAQKNTKTHKVNITFKRSDLLSNWSKQPFDTIVANLPYLAKETDPSTKFEPRRALVAEKLGLNLIEKLLKQVSTLESLPSSLFLEIGHDQGSKIKNLTTKLLPGYETKILRDLSKRIRFAVLVKKSA